MKNNSYQSIENLGGVIIEGADQMGKTTVVNKLTDELQLETIHFGIPDGNESQYDLYTAPIKQSNGPFIIDRSYVSEMVYGELFRKGSKVTPEIQSQIEKSFTDANYFLVICKRKNYKWKERKEDYTKEQNEDVIKKFDEVCSKLGLDYIVVYPFEEDALGAIIKKWREKNNIA